MTTQSHSNLQSHSAPFQLSGLTIQASLVGTIADGVDQPELQQLVGGQWLSLNPALRWASTEKGGTKKAQALPNAAGFRWTVPVGGHVITTNVNSAP